MLRTFRGAACTAGVARAARTGKFTSLQPLEPRRLFAVNLQVSNLAVPTGALVYFGPTFPDGGSDLVVEADVKNIGTTTYLGTLLVTFTYSLDAIFGNADDGSSAVGGQGVAVSLAPGATTRYSARGGTPFERPAGNYYLRVTLEPDPLSGVTDASLANNSVSTPTPAVRVVTEKFASGDITGTDGNDVILVQAGYPSGRILFGTINGVTKRFPNDLAHIFIDAGSGNDKVVVDPDVTGPRIGSGDLEQVGPILITGAGGNDTIVGGAGDDELSGANGKDKVFGGAGNDYLLGSAQADYLNGEAGNDTMSGAGGNDRLTDVAGKDYFLGGAGNDVFVTRDTTSGVVHNPDTVSGGAGTDRGQVNEGDVTASLEELLA